MGLTRGFIRGKALATTDDLNSKANSSHTHSTSQITSGTLPLARGGTGVTSISALKSALGISSSSGAQLAIATGAVSITTSFSPKLAIVVVAGDGGTEHVAYGFTIRGQAGGNDDCMPMVIYNQDDTGTDKHYLDITWRSNGISLGNTKWVDRFYNIAVFGY